MELQQLQAEVIVSQKRGLPAILAGTLFWFVLGLLGLWLPESILPWCYVFGIGTVFPLALLLGKVLGIDMLQQNTLTVIGGLIGGIQIFFAPIVILALYKLPEWLPFITGVLTGAHFLPYRAIYRSNAYIFQTAAVTLGAALTGMLFPAQTYIVTPFVLCAVYGITLLLLKREMRFDK